MVRLVPRAPLPRELHAFLRRPNAAVITTLRSDGQPHAVPTWYEWRNDEILVNMDESRLRLRYMRRDPRVALSIVDQGDWYTHVSILGHVREIYEDVGLADIDRLSLAYRGAPYRNRERRRYSALVAPERWFTHGEPEAYDSVSA
jgi:PPOX class probable F420-dependent enzyme